jgi:hypothetical protein
VSSSRALPAFVALAVAIGACSGRSPGITGTDAGTDAGNGSGNDAGADSGGPGSTCLDDWDAPRGGSGCVIREPTNHRPADCVPPDTGAGGACLVDANCADGPQGKPGTVCNCATSSCTVQPGSCRVDADCGAGGFCSPTWTSGEDVEVVAYECHTCEDQCIDDTDCTGMYPGGYCIYNQCVGYWTCSPPPMTGG